MLHFQSYRHFDWFNGVDRQQIVRWDLCSTIQHNTYMQILGRDFEFSIHKHTLFIT